MDCALVFTDHGLVAPGDLLAVPAWLTVAAAGEAFIQLAGYRFEFREFVVGGAGVHCGVGSVERLCTRHRGCVLVRDRSRAVARL